METTISWIPESLQSQWRRQWRNALPKGTRQLVPALVDPHNPGLTGPVQNQPDFQAGSADHRTHFASAVPSIVRQAMAEYSELSGREYTPVHAYDTEDADYVMVGMGSITDDVRAILPYLRSQGLKVGVVSIKMLQPFPEAELVAAIGNAKAVTVLERSDDTALNRAVTQALFHARANAEAGTSSCTPACPRWPRSRASPRRSSASVATTSSRATSSPASRTWSPATRRRWSTSARSSSTPTRPRWSRRMQDRLRSGLPRDRADGPGDRPQPAGAPARGRCGSGSTRSAATARSRPASCSPTC